MITALLLMIVPGDSPPAKGQIAFMRGGKVCVLDVSAGKVRELASERRYSADRPLAWSPDGKQLIYWNHSKVGWDLWSLPVDGGTPRNLTNVTAGGCRSPSFSPDGRRIAFLRDAPPGVHVMDADGGNPRRLTDKGHRDDPPAWSPDGKQLAFMHIADADFDLYLIDVDRKNEKFLLRGGSEPTFHPDGKRLILLRQQHGARIAIYNLESKQETLLTDTSETASFPTLSPDGSTIAFLASRDNVTTLTVMDIAGKNRRSLAPVDAVNFREITWSPDGLYLAYITESRDKTELRLIHRDGAEAQRLLDGNPRFPTWRPLR